MDDKKVFFLDVLSIATMDAMYERGLVKHLYEVASDNPALKLATAHIQPEEMLYVSTMIPDMDASHNAEDLVYQIGRNILAEMGNPPASFNHGMALVAPIEYAEELRYTYNYDWEDEGIIPPSATVYRVSEVRGIRTFAYAPRVFKVEFYAFGVPFSILALVYEGQKVLPHAYKLKFEQALPEEASRTIRKVVDVPKDELQKLVEFVTDHPYNEGEHYYHKTLKEFAFNEQPKNEAIQRTILNQVYVVQED